MKIHHKPYKNLRGYNQKRLPDVIKTQKDYEREIIELKNCRTRYYGDMIQNIQLIELKHKSNQLNNLYKNVEEIQHKVDAKHKELKENIVKTYNELVRPIDRQLHLLRNEVIKRFLGVKIKICTNNKNHKL